MLAELHATCVFDFDDTPSARRVARAAEETEDPDFWERLAAEDLRADPRVSRYVRLAHELPLLDGVFLDLARMRDMVPSPYAEPSSLGSTGEDQAEPGKR